MSVSERRGLLTIGALLIIVVISILAYAIGVIDAYAIVPLIVLLSGFWTIALAGIRASNPQKYEREPFGTLSWGVLMAAVGGSYFLYIYTANALYALALELLALAAIAIATALRRK